jgi:hypothetical protein
MAASASNDILGALLVAPEGFIESGHIHKAILAVHLLQCATYRNKSEAVWE